MTENQSTELHLDLCPERTAHLLEALAIIKENFQMVDEILSAGLKNICNRISHENGDSAENIESLAQDGHRQIEEGDAGDATAKAIDQEEKDKHRQCCCMCTLRVNAEKKHQLISKSSVTKGNITIDPRLATKKRTGKPRLNRTASLRRESAAERRASQVQPTPR